MTPYPLSSELFSYLYDPGMSETERHEFVKTLLKRLGTKIEDFEVRLESCLEEGSTIAELGQKIKLESILIRS